MIPCMKIKASAVVLALCCTLPAEEPVELKWHLAKGDRFGMEISSEAHQEHNETENNYESTRTLRLSAVMEVVEAEGGAAKVEIRVHRTTGKSRVKEEEVEDTDLGTEASDWEKPLRGSISERGLLEIDATDLMEAMQDTELPLFDVLLACFPQLPENAVKPKEPWAGAGTPMGETWQVVSVKKTPSILCAFMEGTAKSESKVKVQDEKKEATQTGRASLKAEFDLKAGFLKSIESRFTMETRLPSKGKPLDLATTARTVTLSKLEPAKK